MRKTQPEAPGLHLSRWLFILFMFGHALAGCDGGSPTNGNTVTNTSTFQTDNAAAKAAVEKAAALETATALQDAVNQPQEATLQKFGTGVFGQSTFR
jgi:hypothetical protein